MPHKIIHTHPLRAALFAAMVLSLGACAQVEDALNQAADGEVGLSHYGSTNSHNAGQNCMSCHTAGGAGRGAFTLAGTVYSGGNVAPNTTVYIYSDQNFSNRVATLEVDGKGNFYTVATISGLVENANGFVDGVFVKVEGADGQIRSMSGTVSNGACNECHSPSGGVGRIH